MKEYNVDTIYKAICALDKDYVTTNNRSSLFIRRSIAEANKTELMINWLSLEELKELLNKIDEKMEKNNPYDQSIIMRNFYNSIKGRIHVQEKDEDINKLRGRL
jgi:hypothetical protein